MAKKRGRVEIRQKGKKLLGEKCEVEIWREGNENAVSRIHYHSNNKIIMEF